MLNNLFNKFFKKSEDAPKNEDHPGISIAKNWYSDRYDNLITQRNILALLTIISFIAVVAAIFAVRQISISKSFSPFVIQIEERTGSAKIVNPVNSELLSADESLARYFIKKYLSARETYNPVDFERNTRKVVRLFSAPQVYRAFMSYIRDEQNDPTIIYGQRNETYIRIKSFQKLRNQYFIRFSVVEKLGNRRVFDKIATVTVEYIPMELTEEERDINPVGFQVTGYRVDDDRS